MRGAHFTDEQIFAEIDGILYDARIEQASHDKEQQTAGAVSA
jgi:hypothetical protein